MGLNQHQNEKEVTRSSDTEDDRQIRINRNLARFLADQTAHQRISKRRQYQHLSVDPSADVKTGIPTTQNQNPNRCVHYGMKLAEEYHQIQRRGDQDANKNLNHETNPRPLVKQASLNPQNEQTRKNILNNNLNDNTPSKVSELNLKNSLNQTNKRCTMRVSKLIGRSLTFSCMF